MKQVSLLLFFFLAARIGLSQQQPDPVRLNSVTQYSYDQLVRLADAGKVWGYLKYHHPYLQYKAINWDSAFVALVPEILQATNRAQFEACLSKLLSVLNDPVTAVLERHPAAGPTKLSDVVIIDSIMIITRYDDRVIDDELNSDDILRKARQETGKVRAVIFDLRTDRETYLLNDGPAALRTEFGETRILSSLFKGTVPLPSIRTVLQKGFISETPSNNCCYQASFVIERRNSFTGTGSRDIPIVFIINRYSNLPLEAVGLQMAGKAKILQEGDGGETGIVPDVKFQMADSIRMRVRLGELVFSGHSSAFQPDLLLPESANRQTAINNGRQLLFAAGKSRQKQTAVPDGFESNIYSRVLSKEHFPSVGERVLAISKIYSVIKHFYPHKNLLASNWDSLFIKFLPRFLGARDAEEYSEAVFEMYTNIQDGHGFIVRSSAPLRYRNLGGVIPPFTIRIVENKLVVFDIIDDSICTRLGIERGDIIVEKDGKVAMEDINRTRKYFSASNYDAQSAQIANRYLRGAAGTSVNLKLLGRSGKPKTVELQYSTPNATQNRVRNVFAEKGNNLPVMYFVTKDIGYVNLGALKTHEVDSMFNMFRDARGIIFDLRAYPRSPAVYLIAPRLGMPYGSRHSSLPGTDLNYFRDNAVSGSMYKGKIVCLVDENTISAGETAAGILYKATLIGNHTAGANGAAVNFFIPGDIRLTFTGSAVKVQGAGMQPHIFARPTIKGLREGRDEVLDRAVRFLTEK